MIGDFALHVSGSILVVLLVGVLAALGFSFPAARGALDRHGWPFALLAVIVAAGLGWLILLAIGDDTYFAPDHVSRWDFAARNDGTPIVVSAIVLGLLSIIALATAAWSTGSTHLRRFAMPAGALASAAILVAAFKLTVGH
jgi:hypothetical protein